MASCQYATAFALNAYICATFTGKQRLVTGNCFSGNCFSRTSTAAGEARTLLEGSLRISESAGPYEALALIDLGAGQVLQAIAACIRWAASPGDIRVLVVKAVARGLQDPHGTAQSIIDECWPFAQRSG